MAKHDSNFLHLTHIINKFSLYLMISQLVEEQQRWTCSGWSGPAATAWGAKVDELEGGRSRLWNTAHGKRKGKSDERNLRIARRNAAQWKTLRSDESWSLAAGRTRSDEPGRLAAEPRLISGAFALRRHTTDDCVPLRVFLVVEIMTCQSLQKRSLLGGLNIR